MSRNCHRTDLGASRKRNEGEYHVTSHLRASALAVAIAAGWALPAQAQDAGSAAIQQELAAMRAQMQAMAQRIDTLEGQLAEARAKADAAQAAAAAIPAATPAPAAKPAEPAVDVAWRGSPELKGKNGWSFKPRGRLMFDAGWVGSPPGVADKGLGFVSEVRRARLGVEGTMPGGFGYRFDVETNTGGAELFDAYITYTRKDLTVTVGQHNNFQALDELTSSNNSAFMERAAFTDAFNYNRILGVSATWAKGDVIVEGGVFTDNISALQDDENNGLSFAGRVVYAPKLGNTQLHFGASARYRNLNDVPTVRYRQRPLLRATDTRFIDTGAFSAESETGLGLEFAAIRGPFHAAAEASWQKVGRPTGLPDSTFFGGYAEVGYFLTKGDSRGYKEGMWDRVRPKNGFDKGGAGALMLAVRYDYLDLNSGPVIGGVQNAGYVSLVWNPTSYIRFLVNYGKLWYDDARVISPTKGRSYSVDVIGTRAQIDF